MKTKQSDRSFLRARPMTHAAGLAAAMLSFGFAGAAHATILLFDQVRLSNGDLVPTISGNGPETDYGDRVTGSPMAAPGGQFTYGDGGEGYTPNITTDFFATSGGVGQWTTQYGDLTNVLFGDNNSMGLNVQFSAEPGFLVQLYSFDLGGFAFTDYTINSVSVFAGSSALFSQNNVLVQGDSTGPRHTAFDFATPLSGSQLLIAIDYSNLVGGQQDNIGIDNIRFGQDPPDVLPPQPPQPPIGVAEPSSLLLIAAGVGALLIRRRRVDPLASGATLE